MNSRPCIAETIIYRHPCHCEGASRPLADGEESEHRFDVDGEPFPFRLTEEGPVFTDIGHGLFTVKVTLFVYPERSADGEFYWEDAFGVIGPNGLVPVINAQPFPWVLTEDGYTLTRTRKTLPMLTLTFLARDIDVDCNVNTVPATEVIDADGNFWADDEFKIRHQASDEFPEA